MGILDTLLSLLGLGDSSSDDGRRETTVSVEREANTGTEAAVKGTDAADIDADTETEADIDADTETEADTVDVEDAEGGSADTEAVDVIKGIGPAYAERLANEGVHSVADLAAADVSELAEAVDLSETRVGRWVERAQER